MAIPKKENTPPVENLDAFFLEPDSLVFKEMFDNAKDAMLVKHACGSVHCYVNRSACEMTGYTFGELTNIGFIDLVHPEELSKLEDRWEKQRKGMDLPSCYETRIVTKNGKVILSSKWQ